MIRASLSEKDQQKAIALYLDGLSAKQVADTLGVSIGAIYYPLRRFKISRRTSAQSNTIRFNQKPLSYSIKSHLSPHEEQLKLAAVMLYWAEGYKIGKGIDFANSDPTMALLFRRFLTTICGINEKRLRCNIYCYEGQDVKKLTAFWSTFLNVPSDQFTKPYIKAPAVGRGSRGPRMVHGLIHLCYSDLRLLRQIQVWIAEYSDICVGGGVVNRTRL